MPQISFTVFGDPKAKAIRLAHGTRKDGTYFLFPSTTKAQREWKRRVVEEAEKNKPDSLLLGAIEIECEFYLSPPKHLPKTKFQKHLTKLDIKNLYEMVEDALTRKFFNDDGQVVAAVIRKHYARRLVDGKYAAEAPRVKICVRWEDGGH